jgi:hypothetical protein
MTCTIEQAISDLIISNKAVTVANTFPVYMRLAGFNVLCDEAVISFEHAMDKYPAQPPKARATFVKQIKELRDGYWFDKLRATQINFEYCATCDDCNEYVRSLIAQGIFDANTEVTCTPLKKPLRVSLSLVRRFGLWLTDGKVVRRERGKSLRLLSRLRRLPLTPTQHLQARFFLNDSL